jgi:TolA-binding protein
MSIETRAARVLVVGTRFDVDADASGNTVVTVSEGVVQVVPRRGGEPRFVRAGERLEVRAQDAVSDEQAVRDAMQKRIAAEDGSAQAAAAADGDADAIAQADSSAAEGESSAVHGDSPDAARRNAEEQSPERRLEAARELLMQGKHSAARERLQKLAKSALPTGARVEALTLIAESYTAQGQIPRATDAYREAVRIAPKHPAAHNALFALARLVERYTEDKSVAGATYRQYLQAAPSGALAPQAREALCRLGDASACE